MLFNSIDFAVFLPLVFICYWFVFKKNIRCQNAFIVLSSYVFYSWWDWRFLSLIVFSTLMDYVVGRCLSLEQFENKRRVLLCISIVSNLVLLGFFKYFNFFIEGFVSAFSLFGSDLNISTLTIILPVGISFYTFQTMSYTIDVYKKKITPTKDLIAFSAFVCFFPQLVAGPIERAKSLLPQFYKARVFNISNAVNGMRQILWGLVKKIVVADSCAEHVNLIFSNPEDYSGSTLVIGAVLFTFQIYGDFSGYSDIAIGVSRLFGFKLMQNFAYPYFSRDIAEFWRRWHISLSTWFRDYLYIPLGGSRGTLYLKIRNTFIIFVVSGFWHGANWTFIAWGALNALYFLPIMLAKRNRRNIDIVAKGKNYPSFRELSAIIVTFMLTSIAWVFFRADNVLIAFDYLFKMFSVTLFTKPEVYSVPVFIVLSCFIILEWKGRESNYAIEKIDVKFNRMSRWIFYFILSYLVIFCSGNQQEFIYFQF